MVLLLFVSGDYGEGVDRGAFIIWDRALNYTKGENDDSTGWMEVSFNKRNRTGRCSQFKFIDGFVFEEIEVVKSLELQVLFQMLLYVGVGD